MDLRGLSSAFLAMASTTAISVLPNVLLYLIPVTALSQKSINGLNVKKTMLSFACGGLLGDVFFHTLPHLLGLHHDHHHGHHHGHHHDHDHHQDHHRDYRGGLLNRYLGHLLEDTEKKSLLVASNILAGFLIFFILERVLSSVNFGEYTHDMHKKDETTLRGRRSRSRTRSRTSSKKTRDSSSGGGGWLVSLKEAIARLKGRLGAQGWLNLAALRVWC